MRARVGFVRSMARANVVCVVLAADTVEGVEAMARDNHWQSHDGWHSCPRHPRKGSVEASR
jgi:hypothetical protein